jgi:hypothetical protein
MYRFWVPSSGLEKNKRQNQEILKRLRGMIINKPSPSPKKGKKHVF